MANSIPPAALEMEEIENLGLEIVHCEMCGDYHTPDFHPAPATLFSDDEPAEA